jgi:sec-independent protein translocase protein TatA
MFEGILQPRHLLVILVVALFIFGPKKLPELGKGLAEGIRNFKKAISDTAEPTAASNAGPDKPQTPQA